MNLTIIRKSIGGSRFQKSLSLLTIVLTTLLLSCMLNITLDVGNQISKDLRSYGSNIVVLPKGATLSIEVGDRVYAPLVGESYLEESRLHLIKEIFWRNNITAFAPFLDAPITLLGVESARDSARDSTDSGTQDSTTDSTNAADSVVRDSANIIETKARDSQDSVIPKDSAIILTGTYFDKIIGVQDEPDFSTGVKNLYPMWNVRGEWVSDEREDSALIGEELATRLGAKIGDRVNFKSESGEAFSVKIVGILEHSGVYDNRLLAPLSLAQKIIKKDNVFAKAEVSAFTIPENDLSHKARRDVDSLDAVQFDTWYCSAFVSSIAYQIEEDFTGASAKAQINVSDAESSIVGKIQGLMGVVSVICLLVASIGIGSLLSAEFQRRRKEIALLKVLGASLWQIYVIFAAESCVIAIVGAIIGFFLGVGISQIISISIFAHFLSISWIALPLSMAFALLVSLCGSLFLLRGITQLLPARVLYGK